ncbi:MAG: A/G-specific adenine glycosylase [Tannerellaceae bacterium]|jgi:A/G-specific adenine glycosylase|nr:A/G-specific adenine glycosylase [Tannerellaceae bacterium]
MEISDILIDWYGTNKRDLPWRKASDPYIIWISEIILQQTRVAQGKDYFLHFTGRFPDVQSLAEASEDEALKYWEGLGYYSRARNLHAAARQIMEQYGGKFPAAYNEVLSLKGIGAYTAAAIVSFVWNKPYPVVDGNVFRVLSRLFALDTPIDTGKGKKEYTELAASVMNPAKAALHNQAIMEFGALQCTPQNPACMFCPLQSKCLGYASGSPLSYPVKRHKTKTRNRYFYYLHIIYRGKTWLNRRSGNDIWKGLYEFPLIETEAPVDFAQLQGKDNFRQLIKGAGKLSVSAEASDIKHVLSHQILYATFYKIKIEKIPESLQSCIEIPCYAINEYAIPRLLQIYLEK